MPSGFSVAAWSLMKSWPCRIWMRSPGSPTTRLTQACERSPGQRNTTTSPRFGVSPNSAAGLGQRDLDRQRRRAVAIGEFRRQQRVADQKRRLHRAGRHVKRLGQRALGDEHDQHDRRQLGGLRAPAGRLGRSRFRSRSLTSLFLQPSGGRCAVWAAPHRRERPGRSYRRCPHPDRAPCRCRPLRCGSGLRPVTYEHCALDRRADLAILDHIGLGAREHVFAGGDIDLAAAEIWRKGRA